MGNGEGPSPGQPPSTRYVCMYKQLPYWYSTVYIGSIQIATSTLAYSCTLTYSFLSHPHFRSFVPLSLSGTCSPASPLIRKRAFFHAKRVRHLESPSGRHVSDFPQSAVLLGRVHGAHSSSLGQPRACFISFGPKCREEQN